MKYTSSKEAIFLNRPNRFIANVLLDGNIETVHVKNTGRCKEILTEGTTIFLEESHNKNRKTKYSLISAYKGNKLINIDSQVPNVVVFDGIKECKINEFKNITFLKREVNFDKSRFDLYYEKNNEKGFIEIKGVTLEKDGISMFPDAPTERGTKHLEELIKAVREGLKGYIFFLIQMDDIKYFTPNFSMDKKFSETLIKASEHGVGIVAYNSLVKQDEIVVGNKVKVFF